MAAARERPGRHQVPEAGEVQRHLAEATLARQLQHCGDERVGDPVGVVVEPAHRVERQSPPVADVALEGAHLAGGVAGDRVDVGDVLRRAPQPIARHGEAVATPVSAPPPHRVDERELGGERAVELRAADDLDRPAAAVDAVDRLAHRLGRTALEREGARVDDRLEPDLHRAQPEGAVVRQPRVGGTQHDHVPALTAGMLEERRHGRAGAALRPDRVAGDDRRLAHDAVRDRAAGREVERLVRAQRER